MTTTYENKQIALTTGIRFAGRDITIDDLRLVEGQVLTAFGSPLNSELYELENSEGITIRLGIEFLAGEKCCLWLISPEGFAVRT